jgi:NhaA family Na+:H+ antiporter
MSSFLKRAERGIADFLKLEAAGGILLVLAAGLAIVIANSPLNLYYDYILNGLEFRVGFGEYDINKSVLHWINDGLMALFFFLVGLEIKREVVKGQLSSRARAGLPVLAAVGGMAAPAAVYWFINHEIPANLAGWAIPAATDIAFALGVLSLLGKVVPLQLKILLTAIAVIDDLLAIVVIALFYTSGLALVPLLIAGCMLAGLLLLNRMKVTRVTPYLLLGLILWVAVLKSGVHATLAGVACALFIPVGKAGDTLEHSLHPWVAFAILPIFAFANAGVPLHGFGLSSFQDPLTLGIMLGLFLGKPLGIFTTLLIAIQSGLSPMPEGVSWKQLFALSVLCGIGFTMSLFIGSLAFESEAAQAAIRIGVLGGSLLSAFAGYGMLRFWSARRIP